jgi:hypothetical protein
MSSWFSLLLTAAAEGAADEVEATFPAPEAPAAAGATGASKLAMIPLA